MSRVVLLGTVDVDLIAGHFVVRFESWEECVEWAWLFGSFSCTR